MGRQRWVEDKVIVSKVVQEQNYQSVVGASPNFKSLCVIWTVDPDAVLQGCHCHCLASIDMGFVFRAEGRAVI
jgi:hypothetical protein